MVKAAGKTFQPAQHIFRVACKTLHLSQKTVKPAFNTSGVAWKISGGAWLKRQQSRLDVLVWPEGPWQLTHS
ncbi:MAG: hypothetical protein EOP84_10990 [Verrucomicrobiaceae bacterium]|nr:MAG: hypothetical protein EOP84_10990 [Verrucomicrobiaceae bacterium]